MGSISERLRIAYEEKGLSYQDLAKQSGVPKATIQRYVAGNTDRIDIDKLQMICNALGVDVSAILGWSDSARTDQNTPESDLDLQIIRLLSSLPESKKRQAIDYLRFLAAQEDNP